MMCPVAQTLEVMGPQRAADIYERGPRDCRPGFVRQGAEGGGSARPGARGPDGIGGLTYVVGSSAKEREWRGPPGCSAVTIGRDRGLQAPARGRVASMSKPHDGIRSSRGPWKRPRWQLCAELSGTHNGTALPARPAKVLKCLVELKGVEPSASRVRF